MKTLYLRNVPDEVVERLAVLAAQAGSSVGAAAVRELAEVTRRVDNDALLASLPDIKILSASILEELDAARSER